MIKNDDELRAAWAEHARLRRRVQATFLLMKDLDYRAYLLEVDLFKYQGRVFFPDCEGQR